MKINFKEKLEKVRQTIWGCCIFLVRKSLIAFFAILFSVLFLLSLSSVTSLPFFDIALFIFAGNPTIINIVSFVLIISLLSFIYPIFDDEIELLGDTVRDLISDESGDWKWWFRFYLLVISLMVAVLSADLILQYLTGKDTTVLLNEVPMFRSSFFVLVFTMVFSLGVWAIKTHDRKKEFRDTFVQKNEILFSNALQLLFRKENLIEKTIGLKELVKLHKSGMIERGRIDAITSSGLHLQEINLRGVDLGGTNFSNADFTGADFSAPFIKRTDDVHDYQNQKIYQKEERQPLDRAADLSNAVLINTSFIMANLRGVNFRNADLRGANLSGSVFACVDFRGANLSSANISHCNMNYTNFGDGTSPPVEGFLYDDNTNFQGIVIDDKTLADVFNSDLREMLRRERGKRLKIQKLLSVSVSCFELFKEAGGNLNVPKSKCGINPRYSVIIATDKENEHAFSDSLHKIVILNTFKKVSRERNYTFYYKIYEKKEEALKETDEIKDTLKKIDGVDFSIVLGSEKFYRDAIFRNAFSEDDKK